MGRKKKGANAEFEDVNMTPMIDIVFQMIIFFVCTVDLDRKAFDERIKLAMAPHGKAVTAKDPRTVIVEVTKKGRIQLSRNPVSLSMLKAILRQAVAKGGQTTPVVIRGDGKTNHAEIKSVMDACSEAGLWKVKFAALREKAE